MEPIWWIFLIVLMALVIALVLKNRSAIGGFTQEEQAIIEANVSKEYWPDFND